VYIVVLPHDYDYDVAGSRLSRRLLTAHLSLFPRRFQLPIPLGMDLLLMPCEQCPSA
jgi:hypothetical protein